MQVFVALLGEGTDVWRPVQAEPVGGDRYRLLGTIPDGEVWQFQPGDTVHCITRKFSGGTGLAAINIST